MVKRTTSEWKPVIPHWGGSLTLDELSSALDPAIEERLGPDTKKALAEINAAVRQFIVDRRKQEAPPASDLQQGLNRVIACADELIFAIERSGTLGMTAMSRAERDIKQYRQYALLHPYTDDPADGDWPYSVDVARIGVIWLRKMARLASEMQEDHKSMSHADRRQSGPGPRSDFICAVATSLRYGSGTSWNGLKDKAGGPLVETTKAVIERVRENAGPLKHDEGNAAATLLYEGLAGITENAIRHAIKRGAKSAEPVPRQD